VSDPDPISRKSLISALGWAAYLGISWTWCIGMFLPVLLVRDYGVLGWIVFAIPNLIGAAAMGWVLRSADSSVRIVREHSIACAAFSVVTILFHFFFLSWMVERLMGDAMYAVIAVIVITVLMTTWTGVARASALIVFLISVTAFVILKMHAPPRVHAPPELPRKDLLFLAPVCVFGFALCPYLDLTFHRARASTEGLAARLAFGAGFGGFFLAMILSTLWYAPFLPRWIYAGVRLPRNLFTCVLGAHLMIQSGFTIGVHLERLPRRADGARGGARAALWITLIAGIGVLLLGHWINNMERSQQRIYHGVEWGEVVYRVFMGFYGLVFPAYVWLCMVPFRGGRPTPASVRFFAVSVALAAPFFWTGFVESRMMYLVPGLALVLLARFLISTGDRALQGVERSA
jgi:hypothetical protein